METTYLKRRGRRPWVLREDFCGTALTAAYWVRSHARRRAIGLDLDEETLQWGKTRNIVPLGDAARRVDLRLRDVRSVTRPLADCVCALNFSYYLLTTHAELVAYFRCVRRSMAPGGVFFLDLYGGWESQQVKVEPRTVESPRGRFKYIWEQSTYNPIDNKTLCHIHFELPGRKRIEKAFSYHWRLYTPAEVTDALTAAGFRGVEIFWDHADDDEDSDYRPTIEVENCPGWLAYVVADG